MSPQKPEIKRINIPHIGGYSLAIKEELQKVLQEKGIEHIEFIPAPLTTKKTVLRGWQLMDENMCLPAKITLGNMLEAIEKQGVNGIIMWDSCGDCRYKVYHILHQNILKRLGYKVKMYRFRGQRAIKDLQAIDKAITKKIALKMLWQGLWRIWQEDKMLFKEQSQIPKDMPKIGIVGEIYTILDPNANLRLLEKLKKQGAFIHNSLPLSEFCFKKLWHKPFFRKLGLQRPDINYKVLEQAKKEAENYFPEYRVGGHGKESVINTIYYAKMGFDGVIHVQPFPCVTGNTNITTEDYTQKPIKDIEIGDKVLTHKGRFKEVIHKWCRNYQGPILKIDCGGKMLTLSLTPEHPVLLAKTSIKGGGRKEIQEPKLIPIVEAKKGDFIGIPIPFKNEINNHPASGDCFAIQIKQPDIKFYPHFKKIDKFILKPDLLRLLGYYLAEGSIIKRIKKGTSRIEGVVFGFNINEKKYIEDVVSIIKQNFNNLNPKVKKYPNRHTTTVEIYSKSLATYIQYLCGSYGDKKKLSSELLNLEPEIQREILIGFFRGDGCLTDKYGETTYRGVTTSWDLASQLFWLLTRNRIKTSLLKQNIKDRKPSWMLKISNAEGIKRLNDELIKVTNRKNNVRFRELKDYFLVPIREINLVSFKGKVYNLAVKKDHSYVANFLAVKNCMPESTVSEFLDEISQDYHLPVNHLTFDQQFGEANLNTRVEAMVNMLKIRKDIKGFQNPVRPARVSSSPTQISEKLRRAEFRRANKTSGVYPVRDSEGRDKTRREYISNGVYFGVDVGSVSTKGVIMDQNQEIIDSFYLETARNPIRAIQQGLKEFKEKAKKKNWHILAAVTTGSGRELAAVILGADLAIDEITCQTLGALLYVPEARAIIEIGGQDSKFIQIDENGVPSWFNLNTICSAGTGSFFMGAAREFGLSIQKFGQIAKNSPCEVRITGRCGVFAESDMVTKQQQGYPKEGLIKGMCMAMPQNFLNNVARNRELQEPIVFTGGVASNLGVVEGFERALRKKVQVLSHNKISGAIGACLYAQSKFNKQRSDFLGFEISEVNFQRTGFVCQDCPNQCDISLVLKNNDVLATFGSICRKWEALTGKRASKELIENKDWHQLLA